MFTVKSSSQVQNGYNHDNINTHVAIQISDGEHEYLILLESYRRSLCILVMHTINRMKKYGKSKSKSTLYPCVNMHAHLFLYAFSLYFILFPFSFFLCSKAMVFAAETQDPHSPVSLTIIPH